MIREPQAHPCMMDERGCIERRGRTHPHTSSPEAAPWTLAPVLWALA